MPADSSSVDPARNPDEVFDLYSVPAFESGQPEVISGRQIGSSKQAVKPGDVLLSRIVPHIRRAWVVPDSRGRRQIASGEWIVFRGEQVYPSYLRYLLVNDSFHAKFMNTVAGVGGSLLRARPAQVADIEIPLPALAEQKRIAAILERADRLRRLRRYGLEMADAFLPAAFRRMFGDPVTNPKRWKIVSVDEVIERFEGGINFNPVSDNAPASEWRVLKVSAVTSGEFLPAESKPITPNAKFDGLLIVRRGDLIMSRANTVELVGAICRVRSTPPKVILPDKLWRVRLPDESSVHPEFLLRCLRMPSIRYEIGLVASGTSGSMKNISQADAGSIRIPLPPLRLQERFADVAERFERIRAIHRESLRQAEHLFQTLLHRAFFTSGL